MVIPVILDSLAFLEGNPIMPELLTVRQLAKRLNLSHWAIYQAVKDGTLPGRRLRPRDRLYFSEPEIMEALKPAFLIRELLKQARAATGAA
jgi:excisionase family DNA binding protein